MTYKDVLMDEVEYLEAKRLELHAVIEELLVHKVVRRFAGATRYLNLCNDDLTYAQKSLLDVLREEIRNPRPV